MTTRPNIIEGDSKLKLKELREGSIDLVITSPPYWGLRDYGEETKVIWNEDKTCKHEFISKERWLHRGTTKSKKLTNGHITEGKTREDICSMCGAWLGQLGLEPTWQEYINHIVEISKLIKRVLKKSGSYYLVLGDTYFGSGAGQKDTGKAVYTQNEFRKEPLTKNMDGAINQPKQKLLLPGKVATALQLDGWICRNDIIWHKPNHMPSSVKDRLTCSTETVFHFVKHGRYFYDLDKIREPHSSRDGRADKRITYDIKAKNQPFAPSKDAGYLGQTPLGKNPGDVIRQDMIKRNIERGYKHGNITGITGSMYPRDCQGHELGKNPSDFWEINTQPFPEAHFAVFPEELVERIIKSSCPEDGIILDPFCGSGTTLKVAKDMGIKSIGIDTSPKYIEMTKKRCGLEYDITLLNKYLKPLETYKESERG